MGVELDHILLQSLRKQDPDGFKALFQKYYKSLCIQAYLLLQDEGEAEDLVQDVFVKFWQEKKFDVVQQSLGAYLTTMVKHAALNLLKYKSRLTKKEKTYQERIEIIESTNVMEIQEMAGMVQSVIAQLPEQCRRIFELVCVEGKKYQEAAALTGVTINTVKTQLRRAFAKLRESLRDYYYFAGLSPILYILLS
jgi:RNA polymerase sigma-70 factor, Bacteroides expansion family 1